MHLVACTCGTLYHLKAPVKTFRCGSCRRSVSGLPAPRRLEAEERLPAERWLPRLARLVFLAGSAAGGLFLLVLAAATILLSDPLPLGLVVIEVFLGVLLVGGAVAFYLLLAQMQGIHYLLRLHMNNLRIFADQLARMKLALRRREQP